MKIKIEIEAHRWFQNGDHPDDEYKKGSGNEGKLVRRYRLPECDGQVVCQNCNYIMHDHGWMDTIEGGMIVCPGDWIVNGVNGVQYPIRKYVVDAMIAQDKWERIYGDSKGEDNADSDTTKK